MRRLLLVVLVLSIAYFMGGGVLASLEMINANAYVQTLGIAGGIASIAGLLAFFQPRLTTADVQAVGGEALTRMAIAAEELRERMDQLHAKKQELESLEEQRKELELLVRRASMGIFLESRIRITRERILQIISGAPELSVLLNELGELEERHDALGLEIESDPNVDVLKEVILSARSDNRAFDLLPEPYRSMLRWAEQALRAVVEVKVGR